MCTCTLPILGDGFHVLGFHKTITACILPPSIPKQILDIVEERFNELLRDDLNKLHHIDVTPVLGLNRENIQRYRRDSIESQTLSLSAGEEGGATGLFAKSMWKAVRNMRRKSSGVD